MLNIVILICISINSALYSSSFFIGKLPEAYAFFESNRRCYAGHTCAFFFLLAFVWQAAVSFR